MKTLLITSTCALTLMMSGPASYADEHHPAELQQTALLGFNLGGIFGLGRAPRTCNTGCHQPVPYGYRGYAPLPNRYLNGSLPATGLYAPQPYQFQYQYLPGQCVTYGNQTYCQPGGQMRGLDPWQNGVNWNQPAYPIRY